MIIVAKERIEYSFDYGQSSPGLAYREKQVRNSFR